MPDCELATAHCEVTSARCELTSRRCVFASAGCEGLGTAGKAGPFPRSARACRDEGGAESFLRDVLLVRGRLPLRGREAEARRARGALPGRELPAGHALGGRIAGPRPDL